MISALAQSLRAQAMSIQAQAETLIILADAMYVRNGAQVAGADAAPFLMGAPTPHGSPTAPATDAAPIPQGTRPIVPTRFPTFDGPVGVAPVAPVESSAAPALVSDDAGDLHPITEDKPS